jgi:hypothetical protein
MDLKILEKTPPWDWPQDADKMILKVLADERATDSDRVLAAKLAGEYVVINDDLVDALLSVLRSNGDSEQLRGKAAISLGPVLEHADVDMFDDPDDVLISKDTFRKIQETLRKLYFDAGIPKEVRRRILEASVRARQDWHQDAIRAAYCSDDEDWKLTAVFSMRFVEGFEAQILEAIESDNEHIQYEAVHAAGEWELDAAWPNVTRLVRSNETDKLLLLAAIDAVASIRPKEAGVILVDLTDSDDEDIVAAAHEAMAMAEGASGDEFDDVEDDEDIN